LIFVSDDDLNLSTCFLVFSSFVYSSGEVNYFPPCFPILSDNLILGLLANRQYKPNAKHGLYYLLT
jgi:hypothetical protein